MNHVFRSRFKEVLDDRGMKQSHFVRNCGISAKTMSVLYRGGEPTLATAYKIAKELGLYIEEIWYYDVE